MDKVHYTYRIHHRPGSHALVRLNGLPVYDRTPDDLVSPTEPITHALVPGENTIQVDLLDAPADPSGATHFMLIIARLDRPDPVDVLRWEFPNDVRVGGVFPDLPWSEEFTFTPQGDPPPPPVYLAAPEAMFPNEGTPDQVRAVKDFYDGFASKDGGAFLDAMRVRMAEYDRAYGENPKLRQDSVTALQEPWVMDPWNPEDLRFERWLDGRVAFVRRLSGKPAVHAVHRDEPFRQWGADLFITQVGGHWRVFR